MKNNLVLSVIVTNFNQEKYILECLESIKNQTYSAIELIVCDDKSNDNSIEKVEKWIKINEKRFVNVIFVKNKVNKGIAGNHNVGLKISTGEYISFIHGDDLLYDKNSVQDLIDYIKRKKILFCSTRIQSFLDSGNGVYEKLDLIPDENIYKHFDLSSKKQFKLLSRADFVPGVMVFNTNFLRNIGGFDEEYRMVEDWPIWLKVTRIGYKINCYPEPFILYRRHIEAISIYSSGDRNFEFYNKYKVKTINEYILPYKNLLSFREKWIVFVNKLYLEKFIKFGCDEKAHKKARIIKILYPFSLIKKALIVIKLKIIR